MGNKNTSRVESCKLQTWRFKVPRTQVVVFKRQKRNRFYIPRNGAYERRDGMDQKICIDSEASLEVESVNALREMRNSDLNIGYGNPWQYSGLQKLDRQPETKNR